MCEQTINMFWKTIVFFGVVLTIYVNCEENCDKLGIRLYEDIGCTPVKKENESCPVKYHCPNYTENENHCWFGSKIISVGSSIDNDLIYPSCNIACRCENPNTSSPYNCAVLDCPEWLGLPVDIGCYRKYEVNKCCSTGQICPEKERFAKCQVDGREYREGEVFYPNGTCLKCVCGKDFKQKFEAPFCEKIVCAAQIRHSGDLEKNCAPLYFNEEKDGTLCCPSSWICPSDSDALKEVNPKINTSSDLTCKFGTQEVRFGHGLETNFTEWGEPKKVKCECVLPPFLTCRDV